jgi:tetratricopeptide (TPR) repeat protein
MDDFGFFELFVGAWLFAGLVAVGSTVLERVPKPHVGARLWSYASRARARGWFSASKLLLAASGRSLPAGLVQAEAAMQLYYEGRLDEACRVADDIAVFEDPSGVLALHVVNMLVCVDVAAGRYERALSRRGPWSLAQDDAILRINEAEALANLGRWEESLAHARRALVAEDALARTGAALHGAWVLGARERAEEARALFALAREADLPVDFRSEYHFAEAFLRLAEGDAAGARRAILRGDAIAIRASSRRNALFLLGRVAAREGHFEEAIARFEEGARHVFRGQGGDGLLAWGDTLASRGRAARAADAWRLVIERDPESYAASLARERLG